MAIILGRNARIPWKTPLMLMSTTRCQLATGGVPQIAELFDTGVVHQQAHIAEIAIDRVGQLLHRSGVAHVADHVDRRSACRSEFFAERRHCCTVDVCQDHSHAQPAGLTSQARTDSGAGTGDDGDPTAEGLACAHADVLAEVLAVCCASGTESSASRTTVIEVNTRPSFERRMPASTTPLDTANGTLLVI